jgi:hypothetical protein
MRTRYFLFLFIAAVLLGSCVQNPLKVDVSSVDIGALTINRLEQDLFKMDTSNIPAATEQLKNKYGSFYSGFIRGIINNGGLRDSSYSYRIKQFIADADMKRAYQETQQKYPDLLSLQSEIEDMFRHYRFHFPQRPLPRTVTMMSGFNYPVVVLDSTLAIGLELYLGQGNEFYKMLAFPKYKTMFMDRQNILPDAARFWMLSEFQYNMDKSDFLSQMIHMGKIMYLTDALLPETADTLKIQYSQKQMEYCEQNEFNVWSYFAAQKLLYTTDQAEIMKFTSDGPFTSALSKESAPRIGYWIGWQIVRHYMKNNPETTLPELMEMTNAQAFLAKSKYKPEK